MRELPSQMFVELRPEAEADLIEAGRWIAGSGLVKLDHYRIAGHPASADRFFEEFEAVCDVLRRYREIGPRTSRRARKKRIMGFPYNVIYRILSDRISIVAVAHHARGPKFYRDRLRR